MSDFGTMASVHRTDHSDVSDSDESALRAAIKQLQVVERDRIGSYVAYSFRIGGSSARTGAQGFSVSLTDYWLDDDESRTCLNPAAKDAAFDG